MRLGSFGWRCLWDTSGAWRHTRAQYVAAAWHMRQQGEHRVMHSNLSTAYCCQLCRTHRLSHQGRACRACGRWSWARWRCRHGWQHNLGLLLAVRCQGAGCQLCKLPQTTSCWSVGAAGRATKHAFWQRLACFRRGGQAIALTTLAGCCQRLLDLHALTQLPVQHWTYMLCIDADKHNAHKLAFFAWSRSPPGLINTLGASSTANCKGSALGKIAVHVNGIACISAPWHLGTNSDLVPRYASHTRFTGRAGLSARSSSTRCACAAPRGVPGKPIGWSFSPGHAADGCA
jgi:hypothetical protein